MPIERHTLFLPHRLVAPALVATLLFTAAAVHPLTITLLKLPLTLSDDLIKVLAGISRQSGGTKEVGKILGRMKLTDRGLEDAYLRILREQGRLSPSEFNTLRRNLGGTPGFRTTLRKITGNSDSVSKGHLNELRIANKASNRGFGVAGIGTKFDDGLKRGASDIDLLLTKNGKTFAVEAKDRSYVESQQFLAEFRRDLDTLVEYRKVNDGVIPVFTLTRRPSDRYMKQLTDAARRRGVELIVGPVDSQVEQLRMLANIS